MSNEGLPLEYDGQPWSREDHIIVFNLYCRIPFGSIHMKNSDVIEMAALLGRKVGAVSRKLANFSRLDPSLHARNVRGLEHGARGEIEVWEEFQHRAEDLAYESTRLLASRLGCDIVDVVDIQESDLPPAGVERDAVVKLRVNQGFFRMRVLSAYDFRCCVTGLSERSLLVASHIVPWAEDPENRLNPRNGLCLNPLHDRAFDRGLMWIESDFTIRYSSRLHKCTSDQQHTRDWFLSFERKRLRLPNIYQPDGELLKRHASRWNDTQIN